eukprot:CAMPEP_0198224936 /NCGR_PEP_ID=MMETSP1445-20131203/98948_1 /TAXON_ID=36898 /ORGANISM="Pyramimonas sp., Strain CCMP2087" /LENGTH=37 /DNA_ID= /DNA_START= /DNA_END= /DNA_ORIENTATION=
MTSTSAPGGSREMPRASSLTSQPEDWLQAQPQGQPSV